MRWKKIEVISWEIYNHIDYITKIEFTIQEFPEMANQLGITTKSIWICIPSKTALHYFSLRLLKVSRNDWNIYSINAIIIDEFTQLTTITYPKNEMWIDGEVPCQCCVELMKKYGNLRPILEKCEILL